MTDRDWEGLREWGECSDGVSWVGLEWRVVGSSARLEQSEDEMKQFQEEYAEWRLKVEGWRVKRKSQSQPDLQNEGNI